MARTNVPVSTLVRNGSYVKQGTTALDATNGHVITAPAQTELLWIEVTNTFAGAKTVTIKAGVYPPAMLASQGALGPVSMAQNEVRIFGPFESGRFDQALAAADAADNAIHVDLQSGTTGTITAFALPKA